ncbi:21793_t:CDS:1 [Entrophospora sp. SA101]|nr:14366_t:CDS:1 [Entrophospora sp. SA101]CAJ0637346.1 7747_t:CDS:1 [Entrophospora sp. SA101]CAJ0749217.1 21793_t:CDS:1 [Entrophospora sp. SA101]CAJ0828499.1 11854_t:CDS:1 [Entrophospora sp. SA101]CAJ0874887.1 14305_t:CDS:1 [Entrophospora sp. SA101]
MQFINNDFSSPLSLYNLPNELLLIIFSNLDMETLINLCSVCQKFKILAEIALEKKFEERKIGLTLYFEQEQRWKFNVNFIFDCVNQQNGNFVFKPIANKKTSQDVTFYHSTVLRKPTLWKVAYNDNVGSDVRQDENSQQYVNLLQKPCPLSIKPRNQTFQKIQNVYRIGSGSKHLKVPYKFTYSTKSNNIDEADRPRSRGGDRIISHLSFECSPSFFYTQGSTTHRLLMSITKSLKSPSAKKHIIATSTTNSSIPPPSPRNYTSSSISYQPETNASRLEEKKNLFSKWSRGARR